ncbi:MAG: hypothetical protein DRQ78_10520 [Epsilonproteobacteria bacterium]|nr:MAG: hypothetical protein DRQ78_10520 [Campylobacterota bacterium]
MARKFIFVNSDGDYQETPGAYEQLDFIDVSTGITDAGKPIVLDAGGLIDPSMIDESGLDHGALSGILDDDHTQYILVDGTRAFSGAQAHGGFGITGVLDPVNAQDAATKAYVDLVAQGLKPKANTRVATTGNISIASAPSAVDGVTLVNGDRVLVWEQTATTENGVYVFNGAGSSMTRSADFDGSVPNGEVWNGSYVPNVLEGTIHINSSFIVVSTGTGTDGIHIIDTDPIVWDELSSPSAYSGDVGIFVDHGAKTMAVDILDADSGLAFLGAGNDELAIQWAVDFTIDGADAYAFKASDMASTVNGKGASTVGIEDSLGLFASDDVEGALAELIAAPPADSLSFTAGENITKGDLVYISANNTVSILGVADSFYAIGIAKGTSTVGNPVDVLKDNTLITGVLTGATAGNKYYWNGTTWTTSIPSGGGSYVWRLGAARNATDAFVEVEFIKRNSA